MNAIQVSFLVFAIIEILNMLELYFMQDNCMFNGICLFSGWEKSVLIFTAPKQTLILSAISMVITIGSFYWRMYPMICKADDAGQIKRKGRSRLLGTMVAGLQFSFIVTIIIEMVTLTG